MLRAIDDVDGQGIYIRKLCDALFELDPHNEYVAFYCRLGQAGRYRDRPNVREVVVPGRNKLVWDQILVPRAAAGPAPGRALPPQVQHPARRLLPHVVQQRGTEYWSHPEFYTGWSGRLDRYYNRIMIPLYCRRAVRVLTNSDSLGDELVRYVGVPRDQAAHGVRGGRRELPPGHRPRRPRARSGRATGCPAEPFLLMVVKGHQVMGQAERQGAHAAEERRGRPRGLRPDAAAGGRRPRPRRW